MKTKGRSHKLIALAKVLVALSAPHVGGGGLHEREKRSSCRTVCRETNYPRLQQDGGTGKGRYAQHNVCGVSRVLTTSATCGADAAARGACIGVQAGLMARAVPVRDAAAQAHADRGQQSARLPFWSRGGRVLGGINDHVGRVACKDARVRATVPQESPCYCRRHSESTSDCKTLRLFKTVKTQAAVRT